MKIRVLMVVLIAAVFVLVVSPAPAQIKPSSVSITPFFGGYTFDSDLNLDTKPVYGLRLGYDITPDGAWKSQPTMSPPSLNREGGM